MVRDMYANNKSTPDMNHEHKVMAMMEARKRAREMDVKDERKRGDALRASHEAARHGVCTHGC